MISIAYIIPRNFHKNLTFSFQVYNQYKKQNARRIRRNKEAQGTDVEGNLKKCYQIVPGQYFDDDFHFNFEYLTSDKEKVFRMQEDV